MTPWIQFPTNILCDGALSPEARLLWVYLAWRQGSNRHAWPSMPKIEGDLAMSRNRLRRALRQLQDRGLVQVELPTVPGRGRSIQYRVCPPEKGCTMHPLHEEKGCKLPPLLREERVQNGAQKGCIMHPQLEQEKYNPLIPPKGRKPKSQDNDDLKASFDRFWMAYPRRVKKIVAIRAWAKLKPDTALVERILKAVEAHKRQDSWLRDGGQYIPHPATWLTQHRWTDEVIAPGQTLMAARRREAPALVPIPPRWTGGDRD